LGEFAENATFAALRNSFGFARDPELMRIASHKPTTSNVMEKHVNNSDPKMRRIVNLYAAARSSRDGFANRLNQVPCQGLQSKLSHQLDAVRLWELNRLSPATDWILEI
jgi:hypothetical protein